MRRLLSTAVAAGALVLGGMTVFPAAPASASLPPYCAFAHTGPNTSSCDYEGRGPTGTFSIVVASGTATLSINCGAGTFVAATARVLAGPYPHAGLISTCHATFSTTGVASATVT